MDDTTKTILGMLSAFIVAFMSSFLAEPVKSWVDGIIKRNNLKLGLYKELHSNYVFLKSENVDSFTVGGKLIVSNLFYNYAIENEILEFYKLRHATLIKILYERINVIKNLKPSETDKKITLDYLYGFKTLVKLDKKNFKKFLPQRNLKEILELA